MILVLLGSKECSPRGDSRLYFSEFRSDPLAIRVVLEFLRLHISSFVNLDNIVLREFSEVRWSMERVSAFLSFFAA